jgi:hypothetical protein
VQRRIQKVPVLHVVALVVVLFQLSWLWNTFYPTQRHGAKAPPHTSRQHPPLRLTWLEQMAGGFQDPSK